MSLFRSLYRFTAKQVDDSFKRAQHFASRQGIKVLCSSFSSTQDSPQGQSSPPAQATTVTPSDKANQANTGLPTSQLSNQEQEQPNISSPTSPLINGEQEIIVNQEPQEFSKLLIITPRKMGKSHQRNKLRRQIKAIFYENRLYEQSTNKIFIVLLYKQSTSLSYEQLLSFFVKRMSGKPKNLSQ